MPRPSGTTSALPLGSAVPMLVACPILAASLLLSWQGQWLCAVALVIVLGVPHGALDVEIGRNLFRDRLGRAWFPAFALPYLTLVALVLVAWHVAPAPTLAAFLIASVWHFGSEDAGVGGLPALAMGGIPVAVPVLMHPEATASVLAAITDLTLTSPPSWLVVGSFLWLPTAALWAIRTVHAGHRRTLALPAALCAAFTLLPPLTAFTLYFVVVHAPAHTTSLIRHPTRAPRVRDVAAAWRLSIFTTALTILIGAALWTVTPGETPVRFVRVTLQLLAALTLPHMLLDAWLTRREGSDASRLARGTDACV
ncbi:MAG: hypothetical protein EON55_01090 [Alphaproteobacteria bacterium]|nr:MAG: hypothetical protein EON55_01090 [Alphaproteobacteria bacterium]